MGQCGGGAYSAHSSSGGLGSAALPAGSCPPNTVPPLRCFQVYVYLNEGERLLKMLKKENSCSQTFESATLYSFKGQVRTA